MTDPIVPTRYDPRTGLPKPRPEQEGMRTAQEDQAERDRASQDEPANEPTPRDHWTRRGHEIITETVKRSAGARPDVIIGAVLHALFSHMSQSPDEYAAHLKALADAAALEEKNRRDAADKAAAETKEPPPQPQSAPPPQF